jgi:putative copper resistance protein D
LDSPERSDLLRRLRRNVIGESCVGLLILLVVGALGVTPPARHIPPVWPFSFRLSWDVVRELSNVQLLLTFSGVGILLAIALLIYGFLSKRHRAWAIGIGIALLVCSPILPFRAVAIEAFPTTFVRPAVPYTALSIANGARLYQQHCASCHGVDGYGTTSATAGVSQQKTNLVARIGEHTAGDLFWWISHGMSGTPMPEFSAQTSERERWELINFLRALASAEEARRLSPLIETTPRLVAPDFRYGIGVGPGRSLKDYRGRAIVHLVLFTLPGSLERLQGLSSAWGQVTLSGARMLAVPMRDADQIYRLLGIRAGNIPVAVEGGGEIVDTYALFRRTMKAEGVPPPPPHMEFLIDRQGYMRARWISGEQPGWLEIPRLLKEISLLASEPVSAPPPDEHVH